LLLLLKKASVKCLQKQNQGLKETHKLLPSPHKANLLQYMSVNSTTNQPLALPVTLDGVKLTIETVDTAAAKLVISKNTFAELWPNHNASSMKPISATLKAHTGEKVMIFL